MADEFVGIQNQEIDLVLTGSDGVIKQRKKVIFKAGEKEEFDLGV